MPDPKIEQPLTVFQGYDAATNAKLCRTSGWSWLERYMKHAMSKYGGRVEVSGADTDDDGALWLDGNIIAVAKMIKGPEGSSHLLRWAAPDQSPLPAQQQKSGEWVAPVASDRILSWLAERDNLVLFNHSDGQWQVRRGSVKGELRGGGDTPLVALLAAMCASGDWPAYPHAKPVEPAAGEVKSVDGNKL